MSYIENRNAAIRSIAIKHLNEANCISKLLSLNIDKAFVSMLSVDDDLRIVKCKDDIFATYKVNEEGTPIFNFFNHYRQLEQDPIYTVYISDDFGFTYKEICSFSFKKPYKEPISVLGSRIKILNKHGEEVNSYTLLPIEKKNKPNSIVTSMFDEKYALVY